jgi:hypothetical protein
VSALRSGRLTYRITKSRSEVSALRSGRLPLTYSLVAAPWDALGGWKQAVAVDARCWLRTPTEEAAGRCVGEGEGHATIVKLKLLEAAMVGAKLA